MKTSSSHVRVPVTRFLKHAIACLLITVFCLQSLDSKSQTCTSCCLSSFPALTVYQVLQTNHGIGFGVEAGTWNKEASKFSYFIGTSMVWAGVQNPQIKTDMAVSKKQTLLSFYVKGQYRITNHFYVVASPGIVNLSYLELHTGIRYVIPVTKVLGIGIEPAYALNQQQFVINANLHIALR